MIVIDFETRSKVDIRKTGSSVDARDESTEVLCLGYTMDGYTAKLWTPGQPAPADLLQAVKDGDEIHAHNALFERLIWTHICVPRFGWLDVQFDQWRCSLAACSRLALPRSLEDAGQALGLPIEKDLEGRRIMLKLARPRTPTKNNPSTWHNNPADFARLYEYCKTDVLAECEVIRAIEELPPSQLKVWQLDQKINLRGMPVDREGIEIAEEVVRKRKEEYGRDLEILTDGAVTRPSDAGAIRKWLATQGIETDTIAAGWVSDTLKNGCSADVQSVLEIRQRAGKSSTSKLGRLKLFLDSDDRVRGGFRYHGASTGRWAGMGFQPHNFPRGSLPAGMEDQFHGSLCDLNEGRIERQEFELMWGDVVDAISGGLRSIFKAPEGHRFLVCDFAGIEARVLAWLAGQENLLALFRDGGDVYKMMASDIYNTTPDAIDKTQRQLGKTAILGCGYGMGGPKFAASVQAMTGRSMLEYFPEDQVDAMFKEELLRRRAKKQDTNEDVIRDFLAEQIAKEVVAQYRETNNAIKQFWSNLNQGVLKAIRTGRDIWVGQQNRCLKITCTEEWLKIWLPSGRDISYFKPHITVVDAPWDMDKPKDERQQLEQVQFYSMNSQIHKWCRTRSYGGKLVENVTQAVAADLLMEAMLRLEAKGYKTVATIHDEIVAEMPYGEGSLVEFEHIMKQVPSWSAGCPIDVEGFESERYRK